MQNDGLLNDLSWLAYPIMAVVLMPIVQASFLLLADAGAEPERRRHVGLHCQLHVPGDCGPCRKVTE